MDARSPRQPPAPRRRQPAQAQAAARAAAAGLLSALGGCRSDLARYELLRAAQRSAPAAFFAALAEHTSDIMPAVYTPTVGAACAAYHTLALPRRGLHRAAGLYVSAGDRGRVREALIQRWQGWGKARVVVLTDGERILGLGDLGAGGLGISVGKILLYTAVAGVDPDACVPMLVDVGTNNKRLLDDPAYDGVRQRRLRGAAFDSLLDEVVHALRAVAPRAVLQFEDFGSATAFDLLRRHRATLPCFNDDIEGTAAVAVAAVLAAMRATDGQLAAQRFLFLGAGEAGTGIADLLVSAMIARCGLPAAQARARCVFLDSKGLVCAERLRDTAKGRLAAHKVPYAHELPFVRTLLEAVEAFKPTVLVGVSTQRGAFSAGVLQALAACCARPLVMPLSNPTALSECTYDEALTHTAGRCLFASGSPFPPSARSPLGAARAPPQANNAYIFPAVGRAAYETGAAGIDEGMFLVAAEALAALVTDAEARDGLLFPPVGRMAEAGLSVCAACCEHAAEAADGAPRRTRREWEALLKASAWTPDKLLLEAAPQAKL